MATTSTDNATIITAATRQPWTPNQVRWQWGGTVRAQANPPGAGEPTPGAGATLPGLGTGTGTGTPGTQSPPPEPKISLTQAEFDATIKDRLERQKRAIDADAQKARDEAEAKRLQEQQKYQQLAEQYAGKIATLEPESKAAIEERDFLRTHVAADMDTAMKEWPAELKALVPAEGDVRARLDAYTKAKAVAEKLGGTGSPGGPGAGGHAGGQRFVPGTPGGPRPGGPGGQGGATPTLLEQERARLQKSGRYNG